MGRGIKLERAIAREDMADFFRELAEAVEKSDDDFRCLDDFRKFKLSGKEKAGGVFLKLSITPSDTCAAAAREGAPQQGDGKPSYKQLKKDMKADFKAVFQAVHQNRMPPQEAVTAFLKGADLMVTYPGYGDEYYDEFINACVAFRSAYESGDLARMHDTVDAIQGIRGHCHAKYD